MFRHRAVAALLLSLPLLATLPAHAQTAPDDSPESRRAAAAALVKTLDEISGPERMLKGMNEAMRAPLLQGLQQNAQLTPAQRERAAQRLGDAMSETLVEHMRTVMPSLYQSMADLYAERFTRAEIEQLQAVYASPLVRKATLLGAEEMPRLMQPIMQSMQQLAPVIQQRMQTVVNELKQEGIDLSPPAPAPSAATNPATKPAAKPAAKAKPGA